MQKSPKGELTMYIYVSKLCAEGIFMSFPWWLKKNENEVKLALFSNDFQMRAILKFVFQKCKQWHLSEENCLNYTQKDTILHVTITVFLKQDKQEQAVDPLLCP